MGGEGERDGGRGGREIEGWRGREREERRGGGEKKEGGCFKKERKKEFLCFFLLLFFNKEWTDLAPDMSH